MSFLSLLGIQLFSTLGVVLLIGSIDGFLVAKWYRRYLHNPWFLVLIGIVGIPLHELGHLLFAVLFRHKIEKVVFFRRSINSVDGFVQTSYNPGNVYHKIGAVFISIAPIPFGLLVIFFTMHWLTPRIVQTFLPVDWTQTGNTFEILIRWFVDQAQSFGIAFLEEMIHLRWQTIVFLYLVLSISLTLPLSRADLSFMRKGIIPFLALFVLTSTLLYLIDSSFHLILTRSLFVFGIYGLFLAIMVYLLMAFLALGLWIMSRLFPIGRKKSYTRY